MPISIAEAIIEATKVLGRAGIPEARREAGSLLSFIIDKDRTFLLSHAEVRLTVEQLGQFQAAVERRTSGEPIQYITGRQDFFGREFLVTRDVLIPRPETELLVEAALQVMGDPYAAAFICDIGTGSGCIALSLLCERSQAQADAVDVSGAAIEVAKQNAVRLGVADRVRFLVSDCFESLEPCEFDLIVSNPPYVAAGVVAGLQREVRDHEPAVALSPGPDGLTIIRRLIREGRAFLKDGGFLIMEIGFGQAEAVRGLIDPSVWKLQEIRPDLQGIPRIVILQKN